MTMKKYGLVFLCAGLLLLSGCQKQPGGEESAPSPDLAPTQSQTARVPSPSPLPSSSPSLLPSAEPSPEPSTEPSAGPAQGEHQFPAFLEEFDFPKVEALVFGAGEMKFLKAWLTEEELAELKESLAMDTWWEATDLPGMGIDSDYCLYSGEEDITTTQSFLVTGWDKEKCLILAKDWNGDHHESYTYYAPVPVLETFEQYISDKNLFPDFVRSFEMDQINVDLPASGTGESGHQVYLLDETQRYSLINALDLDTWTVLRYQGGDLILTQAPALELLDPLGNRVLLVDDGEENCLILCIDSDSYRRYTDHSAGAVVCYQAPAAALKNAQALVDSLTPLGTISGETARYFRLFRNEPGFDMVVRDADGQGTISDDMMAAFVFYVTDYDYKTGIAPADVDAVTQKYFGRKISNYDTGWSNVLPSGNMVPSGWDFHFGCYPILTGTPTVNENGSITARFRVYLLSESLWLDEILPEFQLRHTAEYLLTGRDEAYLNDEESSMLTIEITFRIKTEETDGAQREYVVYDAVRVIDE